MPAYEEVDHTADWAFRVRGRDLPELFANAAQAMFSLEAHSAPGTGEITRDVSVQGMDHETLLVNWLNELLYLGQKNHEAYDRFEVLELGEERLRARTHGRTQSDAAQTHIKAVTFHNLKIEQTAGGWEVTLVVDV